MKSRYAPSFQRTLSACGLTIAEWHQVVRRRYRYAPPSKGLRQLARRVQQAHTGKAVWLRGRLIHHIPEGN